jgi:REase_DpnII-MboI
LAAAAGDDPQQPPHARAFAAWVQHESLGRTPLLLSLAAEAATAIGPSRETGHVAVLGFAASLDRSLAAPFADAVSWLTTRQYFVRGRPQMFEENGLALLGVAVGIAALSPGQRDPARTWLEGLLTEAFRRTRPRDWNESLINAAAAVIAREGSRVTAGIDDDLLIALAAKGIGSITEVNRANAWAIISALTGQGDGMTRAAAQLAALTLMLRDASTVRPGSTLPADVARLLAGVARSLRRWTWETVPRTAKSAVARWDVENEYHVQDLLWAILAPVFPDLDDEEWLKSLGQHHPRADLAIPSLRVIVEVKFLRKGKGAFAAVIEEVAADSGTYLQEGSGYGHIVAFVWDDEARTEEHAELRRGLLQIRGVEDAIVVSRPSKMKRVVARPEAKS